MDSNTKRMKEWLTSELCKQRPEGQPLFKFVLRTASPGSKGTEVDDFRIEHRIELDEIPMMAQNIIARAQEDADGNGPQIQRYVLLPMVKGDSKPVGRFAFRLRGETDMDLDDETGEDAPTNKGLLSQLMRHNEALTRGIATSAASMLSIATRRAESQDRLIEKLLEERQDMWTTLEGAKSDQHTRDMALMIEDKNQTRKDQAFEKLMMLVPVILNRIVGAKALPEKSDPLMMLLEPLVNSLTQDQLQAIGQQLKPEQMISFVELLKTFQQKKLAQSEN